MEQQSQRRSPVRWDSKRQKEVGIAAGMRVRDGQIQTIMSTGRFEDGDDQQFITAARPATAAECALWGLLMSGENNWNTN